MKVLLDTHVFLWFISGDTRLPVRLQQVCQALQHDLLLATVDDALRAYPVAFVGAV
jgi:PIN domain nuclease of toxin-antitoxin system